MQALKVFHGTHHEEGAEGEAGEEEEFSEPLGIDGS